MRSGSNMAAKWVLAVVVVVCLSQGLAHPQPHHHQRLNNEPTGIIDDIVDKALAEAKKVVADVVEKTKDVIEGNEALIEKAVDGIKTGLHTVVNTAQQTLDGLGDKLVAKIEQILKDAEATGLNVTVCAEGKATEAHQIEVDAQKSVQTCLDTAEKVGDDVKAAFETEVKTVEDNLDKIESEVVSCIPEHGAHSIAEAEKVAKCFADELVTIHEQNKETLASITVQVTQANVKVKNAIEEGAKCINGAVQDALTKEKAVIDEVNKCISATA